MITNLNRHTTTILKIRRTYTPNIPFPDSLLPGESAYRSDTKELFTLDENRQWQQYNGGMIIFNIRSSGFRVVPLQVQTHNAIKDRVLADGEPVHVIDEDWIYIGDGITLGGHRVKGVKND